LRIEESQARLFVYAKGFFLAAFSGGKVMMEAGTEAAGPFVLPGHRKMGLCRFK